MFQASRNIFFVLAAVGIVAALGYAPGPREIGTPAFAAERPEEAEEPAEGDVPEELPEVAGREYPATFYPNEPLAKDEIRLIMLGTGSPFATKAQAGSCILVETGNGEKLLFEIGSGSHANFASLGIPYRDVTKIFVGHLHADHVGDLDVFWAAGVGLGRVTPLHVWGPAGPTPELGTAAFVENFTKTWEWDRRSRQGYAPAGGEVVEAHEFDLLNGPRTQVVYEENGVKITAFPAVHIIDGACSYRLDWNGLSMAFSSDTKPNKWMVENAQGVDVLIHEVFATPEVFARRTGMSLSVARNVVYGAHTPPEGVAEVFSLTKPKLAVGYHTWVNFDVVAGIRDVVRKTYDGPFVIARDLMVFNISEDGVYARMAAVDQIPWPVIPEHEAHAGVAKPYPMSKWLLEGVIPVERVRAGIEEQ